MPKINLPEKLLCPITQEMFKEPVIAEDGHTYEKHAIAKWVSEKGTSPTSRKKISNKLITNWDKKSQLDRFIVKNQLCTAKQFLKAIHEGNVNEIKQMNYLESYLEEQDEEGLMALHRAASEGHVEIVKLLVEAKANIEAMDEGGDHQGNTPLIWAACYGHTPVIKVLLEAGAHIEHADKAGWTPLHWASECGQVEAVKLLLDSKAKLEARNKDGLTALHFAAKNGHSEIVKMLLEQGANDKALTADGKTAVQLASQYGQEAVAKLIPDYVQHLKAEAKKAPQKIAELEKIMNQQQVRINQLEQQVSQLLSTLQLHSMEPSKSSYAPALFNPHQ